jgi:hypothetical protein
MVNVHTALTVTGPIHATEFNTETAAATLSLIDNTTAAFAIKEGTNNYLTIDTNDGAEMVNVHTALTVTGSIHATEFNTETAAANVTIIDNTTAAFAIKEGTNNYLTIDTTNTTEMVNIHTALTVTGPIHATEFDTTAAAATLSLIDNTTAAFAIKESTNNYLTIDTNDGAEMVNVHTALTVTGPIHATEFDATAAAATVTIIDNTTAAFAIKEGMNNYLTIDTNDGAEMVNVHTALTVTGPIHATEFNTETAAANVTIIDNTTAAFVIKEGVNNYLTIDTLNQQTHLKTPVLSNFADITDYPFFNVLPENAATTNAANDYKCGVCVSSSLIYLINDAQNQLGYFDPNNDNTITNLTALPTVTGGYFSSAYLGSNGLIYAIDGAQNVSTTRTIYEIDPSDHTTNAINYTTTEDTEPYIGGCVSNNGRIYLIPNNETQVRYIENGSVNTIATVLTYINYQYGIYAPNGRIYSIKYNYTAATDTTNHGLLTINTLTNTVSDMNIYTDISAYLGSDGNQWIHGVIAPNKRIYFIPANSQFILVFNTITETFETPIDTNDTTNNKFSSGILHPNGKIYLCPRDHLFVAELDIYTHEINMEYLDVSSYGASDLFSSMIIAPNHYIYLIPSSGTQIVKFKPESIENGLNDNRFLSRFLNKL